MDRRGIGAEVVTLDRQSPDAAGRGRPRAALPASPELARPALRELVRVRRLITVRRVFEDL